MDADGTMSTHSAGTRDPTPETTTLPKATCIRVREGGEELQRFELDRAGFASALGGPDRRTLFMLAANWRGIEEVDAAIASADRAGARGRRSRSRRRLALTDRPPEQPST